MTQINRTNYFFDLPQDIISRIFEYDYTYHEVWRNIFDMINYVNDFCFHGTWTTCPHPECKELLRQAEEAAKAYEEDIEYDEYEYYGYFDKYYDYYD